MKELLVLAVSFLMIFQMGHCNTTPSSVKKFTINQYLTKYGYMANYDGPPPPNQKRTAIEAFQRYARLPVSGVLDEATVAMLTGPRCGESDTVKSPSRLKRYVKQGSTWKKMVLTWSVHGSPQPRAKISSATVKATMAKSFKMWKDVSKLSFRRLADNDNNVDIIVKFGVGRHGDPYAFDGRGGTLAHAFYPGSNTGLAGDIHFDDDEIWSINGEEGTTDYTWTALHEIGHALGLRHSRDQDAVMWPWFTGYRPNTGLTQDDINGIQDIYGKPTTTITATKRPKSAVCNEHNFDAIFYQSRTRNTYFLKGRYVWEMNEKRRITKQELISTKWPGLESDVDSAYERKLDGDIIFFKGARFWRFRGKRRIKGSSVLSRYIKNHRKVQLVKIDAVMIWKGGVVDLVYFFAGDKFWRYDEKKRKIMETRRKSSYPKISRRYWHSIPFPVDGILTWRNDVTYFFRNKNIYKYKRNKLTRRYKGVRQKIHFIKSCRG